MAKIKVGALQPGDGFTTLLTNRNGVVIGLDQSLTGVNTGVEVRFADEDKWLHPDVEVLGAVSGDATDTSRPKPN